MTWTHDRAQEVGFIPDEEQMRVDVSTTGVRCVVASAFGFRLDLRPARKNEHDGGDCRTKQTLAETHVALPSGEGEYYNLIRGACTSLGTPSRCQDQMIDVSIDICSDSSAARSVAQRRGIGERLTHLQTRLAEQLLVT